MIRYRELFDASFARTALAPGRAPQLVAAHYEHLLTRTSRFEELFDGVDMERQRRMLRSSLLQVGVFCTTGHTATEEMRSLASLHRDLGLTRDDYRAWMDALVLAVADVDPEFTPLVGDAWRVCLAPAIAFMLLPGREVTPSSSSAPAPERGRRPQP